MRLQRTDNNRRSRLIHAGSPAGTRPSPRTTSEPLASSEGSVLQRPLRSPFGRRGKTPDDLDRLFRLIEAESALRVAEGTSLFAFISEENFDMSNTHGSTPASGQQGQQTGSQNGSTTGGQSGGSSSGGQQGASRNEARYQQFGGFSGLSSDQFTGGWGAKLTDAIGNRDQIMTEPSTGRSVFLRTSGCIIVQNTGQSSGVQSGPLEIYYCLADQKPYVMTGGKMWSVEDLVDRTEIQLLLQTHELQTA
jgi:hypothetical protein